MSKERIFKELIADMAKDGNISSFEYGILLEKGNDLGIGKSTIDLLIKMESAEVKVEGGSDQEVSESNSILGNEQEYTFKSAITRGGSILTPDLIVITKDEVIYKKRNKYLINVDTVSLPINKIASVKVDTSIWGTDLIIKSYGAGQIEAKKFIKSDALQIRQLIMDRQVGVV